MILYELSTGGRRLRNGEVHTVRDRTLVETEVFFGWELPHPMPQGQHDQGARS